MIETMKTFLSVLGITLVGMGTVWFLQGINVLPGSFMTGQTKWAVIGALCFLAGVISFLLVRLI